MKRLNRSRILECFDGGESLSRVEVAERTGISLPAVSHLVAELEDQQLLVRIGKGESSGGRRPILYEYNARLAYIVGLDLGGTKLAGGVSDLEGNLIVTDRVSTHGDNVRHGTKAALGERVRDFVLRLLDEADIDLSKVMGIGIGVPGIPDSSGRDIALAPGLRTMGEDPIQPETLELAGGPSSGGGEATDADCDSIKLGTYLQAELGRPVHIDNDVNMIVQGERWKGALQGARHGVCITVGTGIGVGLLTNGELYRGARGAAGEIGYWLIGALGPVTRPDGYGPLERFAAGPGIARRHRDRVQASGGLEQQISNPLPDGGNDMAATAREVAAAAAAGDPVALAVLEETVDMLGIALANLASLVDPETIVIGGGVSRTPSHLFLNPLRAIVETLTPYSPRIVTSELGDRAGVYGAVATVLHSRRSSISFMSPEVSV